MKFVPFTVSVKAAPPAAAVFGLKLVSVGAGLLLLMVNVTAPDKPPPGAGLKTVSCAVPALVTSAAFT